MVCYHTLNSISKYHDNPKLRSRDVDLIYVPLEQHNWTQELV